MCFLFFILVTPCNTCFCVLVGHCASSLLLLHMLFISPRVSLSSRLSLCKPSQEITYWCFMVQIKFYPLCQFFPGSPSISGLLFRISWRSRTCEICHCVAQWWFTYPFCSWAMSFSMLSVRFFKFLSSLWTHDWCSVLQRSQLSNVSSDTDTLVLQCVKKEETGF